MSVRPNSMMMHKCNVLIALLFFTITWSQQERVLQGQIDQNVWKPFKTAFETLDATALNSLYAEDVLRVTPNGIDTENRFKLENEARFETYRSDGIKIELDFWFDSRKTNSTTSYEVGFYRMKLVNAQSEQNIFGQFHIVLKKTNGSWKIAQDWDATTINGIQITSDDFGKGRPLQFD